MKKRQAQQWLQEIYKHPKRYEGKVVIILNDTQIVGVAEDFAAAQRERERLAASSSSGTDSHATFPKSQRRSVGTCISCEFANESRGDSELRNVD